MSSRAAHAAPIHMLELIDLFTDTAAILILPSEHPIVLILL